MKIENLLLKRISLALMALMLGCLSLVAQSFQISGIVKSADGEPIIGGAIGVKGTTAGTITDHDGKYQISVPSRSTILVFSYIGMVTQEIAASSNELNVTMEESATKLDEVVVVGYGVQKKANLTGAVSSLRINDVKDIPVTNTASLLQGRMSGVTVSSFSAQPGSDGDVVIRIRGIGSFQGDNKNKNNPLILIDGVEGSLSSVSPSDIENISVLKDAASAAIYGVRAANGVILVTTKRGEGEGESKLSYTGSYGIQQATTLPQYLDSWKWATLFNEQNNALGGSAIARNYTPEMIEKLKNGSDPDYFANTNWMKETFRIAPIQNHYLSLSGGGNNSNYMTSLGYMKQEGIMKGTDTERVNFRMNTDRKYLNNKLTIGVNAAGSYQRVVEPYGGTWHIYERIVEGARPTVPSKYSNGHWGEYDGNPQFPTYQPNPVEITTRGSNNKIYRFDGKAYLDLELIKNLHFKTSFAYQYNQSKFSAFSPEVRHYKADGSYLLPESVIQSEENHTMMQQWINENLVTYNLNLADVHMFNFLMGQSSQYNGNKYNQSKAEGFLGNAVQEMDAAPRSYAKGRKEEATLQSVFGRINYTYNNRYLLEANIRRDGTSRIPKKNRFGYFPSLSVGWNITEESFWKDQDAINGLKLRASWGKLGNQEVGYYSFMPSYSIGSSNYTWGDDRILGAAYKKGANPDLKWETTTTTNAGLDASLLNSKVTFTFDYFNKVSSDILLQLPVSSIVGLAEAPYVNAAKVKNKGWEINLSYNDKWDEFVFGVNLNLSNIKNEVINVNGRENWIDGWGINIAGSPIGSYFGYVADGLYKTQEEIDALEHSLGKPEIGDIKYLDIDGDDKITAKDRQIIGNPFPEITYGANLNMGYKQFDFTAFFQGVSKVDRIVMDFPSVGGGITDRMWNRYHEIDNPQGIYPRFGNANYNSEPSSYWIENASYLRLKNLELGYTLPSSLLSKIKVQNLRVFFSAQNILTVTGVKNYDPEKYASDGRNWTYPNAKTFSLGLNFNL